MRDLGVILLIGGILGLLTALGMDTSVSTGMYGSGRVNNIGLMNDQSNYLMISALAIGAGLLMFLFDKAPSKATVAPTASVDTRDCPYCGEPIKRIAIKCRYCAESIQPLDADEDEDEEVHFSETRHASLPAKLLPRLARRRTCLGDIRKLAFPFWAASCSSSSSLM